MLNFIIILLCAINLVSGGVVHLNESEYARMPALVHFDPYEQCLKNPEAVYCYAQFELVSETHSPLLDMIKAYSDTFIVHFNHTKPRYGICITETCKNINGTHKDQKDDLEACLNETLWKTHRLKTKVIDKFNCNIHMRKIETGIMDILLFGFFGAILLANIVGTLCHWLYGDQEKNKVTKFLWAFSLINNWKTFKTIPPHADSRLAQLQGFHGLRGIMCIAVVIVHTGMPYNFLLPENPNYVETVYESLTELFVNGPLMMQIFFMMSGCLLIHSCLVYEPYIKIMSWSAAPIMIFKRILRVTPPFVILLALSATWLRFVPAGPIFQHILGNNSEDCRKYWWRHLLFINNYFDNSECMPHTWYLAADTQLYCLGVLIFVLCKTPRMRNWTLMILFAAGLIIPALQAYFQDLDATLIVNPESVVNSFKDNRHFNELYKRGHASLAAYVIGISLGYLIYDWQKKGVTGQDFYKYRNIYRVMWLFNVLMLYSGNLLNKDSSIDYVYLRVLYASLLKPVFTFLASITALGIVFRVENIYNNLLEWRPWVYISRLSYAVYLIHIIYIRASAAGISHTVHITFWKMQYIMFKTTILTFALALLFWLLVEAPAKILTEKFMRSLLKKTIKEVNENAAGNTVKNIEVSSKIKKK